MALGFLDLGCTPEQVDWLKDHVDHIEQPEWEFEFPSRDSAPDYMKGLLARPFLRRYFGGFDVYFWIDADAWVQDWNAVELFVRGAEHRGMALVPEVDRANCVYYGYLRKQWKYLHRLYGEFFGPEVAEKMQSHVTLNAGVFALHSKAPHWDLWAEWLRYGLQRSSSLYTDQTALNLAVYAKGLFPQTELLPAWCNWTCHSGWPYWDTRREKFVEPYLPHQPIGILHLTDRKPSQVKLRTVNGRFADVYSTYVPLDSPAEIQPEAAASRHPASPNQVTVGPAERDYVSPNFDRIRLDSCFPHRIVGNKSSCPWTYLRRNIPHHWYVDSRFPSIGFINPDEAHLLHYVAKRFYRKPGLEIGCWLGWSACHIARSGVLLDVVDPILGESKIFDSVCQSLAAAGVLASVNLIPGASPNKVHELAQQRGHPWSFIFIDGNHDAPYPLHDAMACENYAAHDAVIMFHDLASPDVGAGLDYLRDRGWNTRVFQTMQIMGAAWRGDVELPHHIPDPAVPWELPDHLQGYPVSGVDVKPEVGALGGGRFA